MKIAIGAEAPGLGVELVSRFERCQYFVIVES